MDQTESDKGRDKGGLLLKSISSFLRMVTSIDRDLESNERDTETLAQRVYRYEDRGVVRTVRAVGHHLNSSLFID